MSWFKDPQTGIEVTTLAAFGLTIYDMSKAGVCDEVISRFVRRKIVEMDEEAERDGTNRSG